VPLAIKFTKLSATKLFMPTCHHGIEPDRLSQKSNQHSMSSMPMKILGSGGNPNREQDWGHLREFAVNRIIQKERLAYGVFYYRIPDGESGADVYELSKRLSGDASPRFCQRRLSGKYVDRNPRNEYANFPHVLVPLVC